MTDTENPPAPALVPSAKVRELAATTCRALDLPSPPAIDVLERCAS